MRQGRSGGSPTHGHEERAVYVGLSERRCEWNQAPGGHIHEQTGINQQLLSWLVGEADAESRAFTPAGRRNHLQPGGQMHTEATPPSASACCLLIGHPVGTDFHLPPHLYCALHSHQFLKYTVIPSASGPLHMLFTLPGMLLLLLCLGNCFCPQILGYIYI